MGVRSRGCATRTITRRAQRLLLAVQYPGGGRYTLAVGADGDAAPHGLFLWLARSPALGFFLALAAPSTPRYLLFELSSAEHEPILATCGRIDPRYFFLTPRSGMFLRCLAGLGALSGACHGRCRAVRLRARANPEAFRRCPPLQTRRLELPSSDLARSDKRRDCRRPCRPALGAARHASAHEAPRVTLTPGRPKCAPW